MEDKCNCSPECFLDSSVEERLQYCTLSEPSRAPVSRPQPCIHLLLANRESSVHFARQEKQARDAAGAQRAAAVAAAGAASHRSGVGPSGRRVAHEPSNRGGGRSNPWSQQQDLGPGAAGSRSIPRNPRGPRTASLPSNGAAGGRPATWPHATKVVVAPAASSGRGGNSDHRSGGIARTGAAGGTRPVHLEEASLAPSCPCCRVNDAPELTLAVAGGGAGAGAAASGGHASGGCDSSRPLEVGRPSFVFSSPSLCAGSLRVASQCPKANTAV